jgi:hypothetical protein
VKVDPKSASCQGVPSHISLSRYVQIVPREILMESISYSTIYKYIMKLLPSWQIAVDDTILVRIRTVFDVCTKRFGQVKIFIIWNIHIDRMDQRADGG